MDRPVSPFIFTEYDKISDTLMWFGTSKYRLRFNVQLSRRDNNGNVRSFHSEFGFYNESMDKNCININRDYKYFYSIDKSSGDMNESIIFRQNDIEVLKFVIKEKMYPWFFGGTKSIYGLDKKKNLCLKQIVKPIIFPVSNNSYISFKPIIITFDNTHESKQGVEIIINEDENSFEIDIDNFLQFTSIILNTDMVNAAMTMLNYVKIKPYHINYRESQNYNNGGNGKRTGRGFFDN